MRNMKLFDDTAPAILIESGIDSTLWVTSVSRNRCI